MHLHVLIHGLWGNPSHLSEAERIFRACHPDSDAVHLFIPASFSDSLTIDGIDYSAHRVLLELDDTIATLQRDPAVRITKLSITGYSLGGLVARYLIGILYSRKFFDNVQAVNLTTFTTPHVGVPRKLTWLGLILLGRSGKQLYLLDSWSNTGLPLLQVLAHPQSVFYRGLSQFQNINIYANAINDVTVPYCSGAFEAEDPFHAVAERDIVPNYLPEYEPLIEGFSLIKSSPSFTDRLGSLRPLTFNGPLLEWIFPWNIVLYLLLPIFALVALVYLPISAILSSHASRARIRALRDTIAPLPFHPLDSPPAMSAQQIILSLNALDNVRKFTAFRPGVRNSHAMLICLDARFADHRVGRGVLRHWADHFQD
ncbi:DUF676-domain-containing protein [Roridomyces roridus]|uniref:DUF676-domain-containing protein n=1 Tax=Roridomyces roridus TaxID=1738132 RepID=A0AAD7FJ62_9AGAR|nr:DUF676-domain-containing protein [Roridomyces roridus]